MSVPFTWRDGDRTVRFGRGVIAEAVDVLGGPGYVLLTSERAADQAPHVAAAASAVHHVGAGKVDELAAELKNQIEGDRLVALGGGRVIDVAKAVVAARGTGAAMAIPTTLSGAEMTRTHRIATGAPARRVRPATVVNDPALSASQPEPELAASAANALGHAIEATCTVYANPVATLACHEAARLLSRDAWERGVDRDALALGALLAGWALDGTGYGLHHVLSQTIVRMAGIGHGPGNAALLPHTIGALQWRCSPQHDAIAAAMMMEPTDAAAELLQRSGGATLGSLGVPRDLLPQAAEQAAQRDDLDLTPPRADVPELLALYEQAY